MAKKKQRRPKLTAEEKAERQPTPETMKKLRSDVIAKLARQQKISPHLEKAALEVRLVWYAIGRGLLAGAASVEPRTGGKGAFRDPMDRMTQHELHCWQRHYGPWATWAGRQQVARTTLLDVVLAICCDNMAPSGIHGLDRWLGVRQGRALAALVTGLDKYAEIAGLQTRAA